MPPLKTCRTCAKGKIRCHKTQDSGACDRCARLGKTCVFADSRRHTARGPDTAAGLLSPTPALPSPARTQSDAPCAGTPALISPNPHDPFSRGLLDEEGAQRLMLRFRSTMTPRFPFVVLPDPGNASNAEAALQMLRQERPCLCLAVFAASAFDDFTLQRELGRLFNEMLASLLTTSKLRTLDALQGLLVHLAWAHYHPRPRSYTQQLHLAISIVSDMRLDRPRNPQLWKVNQEPEVADHSSWGREELRALAGVYYLASSSSITLQKLRAFPFTPFIRESCETLALQGDAPGDKHIRLIIQTQRLAEELDDLVHAMSAGQGLPDGSMPGLGVDDIRHRMDALKLNMDFPLAECPMLLLQLGMLELVISQQSLPGFPLSSKTETELQISEVFSESALASRSLLDIIITRTPGHEKALTNIEWISMSYALSFSARLDLLTTNHRMAHLTQQARRCLDFRHTLRQVILKLKGMVLPGVDHRGDHDTFTHFLKRAEIVQMWYSSQVESLPSSRGATPSIQGTVVAEFSEVAREELNESTDLFVADFFAELQGVPPWDDFGLSWGN
ncbi:hypothetical protein B0T16DRAFT_244756 [Cercophora newfieldiana]|uniref:Zn(2)-C6 fungal-type domain-containing protein n=1 Tax=Cercophora newfieldiana TaxID=92897 RepID=A0AA40CID6_9PEZI|nr:hypothetical protein B0T16DRAFT_244756 [Cercophora newfieldiana]